jgi:hypothetical protein
MALEANATPLAHDHSGTDPSGLSLWPTNKLLQVNTHQSADTDVSVVSIHHSLGYGNTQAAAGNHAHDYEGSSIYNKPWVICTSTTRPLDPPLGQMIYETDTNTARVWASFPGDVFLGQLGIDYTYTFNTNNSSLNLDTAIFQTTYPQGASPADGAMGAPTVGNCAWHSGANVLCQAIAQSVEATHDETASDDQILTFTTGAQVMTGAGDITDGTPSASNDVFLRMNASGNTYVRFSVVNQGCAIYFSQTGLAGEAALGGAKANTNTAHTKWTAKAIGNAYVLYRNDTPNQPGPGQQVLAVVDYQNVTQIGPNYRGWGIGMTAVPGTSVQEIPNNVVSVRITDAISTPLYGTQLLWQLLPMASIPHIRVEAHFRQVITYGPKGNVIGWDTVLHDWDVSPYTQFNVDQSAITIQEAGHYQIHSSIPWDPDFHDHDQAAIGFSINGQDIGRKDWAFHRGNGFAPGFAQNNESFFTYYLARGDVVRVWAAHNAPVDQWLWWGQVPPHVRSAWLELDFIGP